MIQNPAVFTSVRAVDAIVRASAKGQRYTPCISRSLTLDKTTPLECSCSFKIKVVNTGTNTFALNFFNPFDDRSTCEVWIGTKTLPVSADLMVPQKARVAQQPSATELGAHCCAPEEDKVSALRSSGGDVGGEGGVVVG